MIFFGQGVSAQNQITCDGSYGLLVATEYKILYNGEIHEFHAGQWRKIGDSASSIDCNTWGIVAVMPDGNRLQWRDNGFWTREITNRITHNNMWYTLERDGLISEHYNGAWRNVGNATKHLESTPAGLIATNHSGSKWLYSGTPRKWSPAPTAPVKQDLLKEVSMMDCRSTAGDLNCSCQFDEAGTDMWVSDWGGNACINISGAGNTLYSDWEGRDYKNELKELANNNNWLSASGDRMEFFGKSLSYYKYEDAEEFLIDVLLASGKDPEMIPISTSTGGPTFDKLKVAANNAIIRARDYRKRGGADPLTIAKNDNRTYDVFLRYRQVTQFEGESNDYEGKITLLKHRTEEILQTKKVEGTCGC